MKTLKQLLDEKNRPTVTINSGATVRRALELFAEHDIGALPVVDSGKLVGMFSERDYARRVILEGKTSISTPISEVMTMNVIYVHSECTPEECMEIMTERHIRHLPVMEPGNGMIGMVSIGDVVKETLSHQQSIISQLKNYIET